MFASLYRYLYMNYCQIRFLRPFFKAAHDPAAVQHKFLMNILSKNRNTAFGKEHNFSNINNASQFRSAVAVQDYDSLSTLILRQETEGNILTDDPVHMFTQTSGTTGRAKLLPMSSTSIMRMKREQKMMTAWQYSVCPQAFSGKALGIVSPAEEEKTDQGNPVGAISGYMYRSMPALFRSRYVLPYEVFEINDYDFRYLVIARLAIQERDITYLGSANPSIFVRLLEVINDNLDLLLTELETDQMAGIDTTTPSIKCAINKYLKADPDRACQLRNSAEKGYLNYEDLWPNIALLMTWTGGSCGMSLNILRKALPKKAKILDPGYLSSECRGSFTCDQHMGGVPMLTSNFYEFAERQTWESGNHETLSIDQLKEGHEYYLLITTDTGLYRYFMNDIVMVTGFLHNTPLIRFLRKGSGVVSITGEKVTESHLLNVMQKIEAKFNFDARYFICLVDEIRSVYQLFVEPAGVQLPSTSELGVAADRAMRASNLEYDQKRKSHRLQTMEVFRLEKGTADSVKRFFVARGQRENQFKPPVLMLAGEFLFPIRQAVVC